MTYFAGLDVSVKETSVCIVDDAGKIVQEARVASEPEALLQVLTNTIYRFKRVGLEAGPLSQWLYSVLAEAGLPVICVETRHMRAMLKAQINKTDRNDARGIAQMMRAGLYRAVHVKTLRSQKLLTVRRFDDRWISATRGDVSYEIDRENDILTYASSTTKDGTATIIIGSGRCKLAAGVVPKNPIRTGWHNE